MRVIRDIDSCCEVEDAVVTIGTFDGVHLGHRQVLTQLKDIAHKLGRETLVISFWPHPRQVLSPESDKPKLLNTLKNKIDLLDDFGIDNLLIIQFTKKFAQQKPEEFIENLIVNKLKASAVVIGYDHRFGQNRSGSFRFLKEKESKYNYKVFEVSALQVGGLSVSSTKIRSALNEGNVEKANTFLGYQYFFEGRVKHGIKLGARLNFPTANVELSNPDKLIPMDGVYIVKVKWKQKEYFGMLNSGVNPSVKNKGRSIEIHLLNFEGNIYNESLQIYFVKRLRDERHFENFDELKMQLEKDKEETIAYLKENNWMHG
jgi:riboflavin kinase/FMN adenylyltransferase